MYVAITMMTAGSRSFLPLFSLPPPPFQVETADGETAKAALLLGCSFPKDALHVTPPNTSLFGGRTGNCNILCITVHHCPKHLHFQQGRPSTIYMCYNVEYHKLKSTVMYIGCHKFSYCQRNGFQESVHISIGILVLSYV